jgi:hypothetical protein
MLGVMDDAINGRWLISHFTITKTLQSWKFKSQISTEVNPKYSTSMNSEKVTISKSFLDTLIH